MDIIPEPHNALPELLIPLLDPDIPYDDDDGDFITFGERNGFTEAGAGAMDAVSRARFLQDWLFFGLLSKFVTDPFNKTDFIRHVNEDHRSRFLSLKNLKRFGYIANSLVGRVPTTDRTNTIRDYCFHAMKFIRRLEQLGQLRDSPAGENGLGVLILVQTILKTVGSVIFDSMPSYKTRYPFTWSSSFLKQHMLGVGWCPQQIAWAFDLDDPIATCFLARLPQRTTPSHKHCTDISCVAYNVPLNDTYKQRHVVDSCTCDSVTVDAELVKEIIQEGGVPVVSVIDQGRGKISLKVSKTTAHCKYTAISHVWSDGIGNPIANAIPQCQAENISNSLQELFTMKVEPTTSFISGLEIKHRSPYQHRDDQRRHESPLFWLDTLCIPVAAPSEDASTKLRVRKLKHEAINKMNLIYAASSQVLVLDSEIQKTRIDAADEIQQLELLGRLTSCTWMRRSWTLQEATLARKAVFQCADGFITPLSPAERYPLPRVSAIVGPLGYVWLVNSFLRFWRAIRRDAMEWDERQDKWVVGQLRSKFQETLVKILGTHKRPRFFGRATTRETELNLFCNIWNNLARRNATKVEDLSVIFATLLNINGYHILDVDPSERMQVLLRGLDHLPIDLLFNTGSRVYEKMDSKLRWIPSHASQTKMHSPSINDIFDYVNLPLHDQDSDDDFSCLRWTESGDLVLPRGINFAVVLNNRDLNHGSSQTFILTSPSLEIEILIRLQLPELDEMQRKDGRQEVLLLDFRKDVIAETSAMGIGGCLFSLLDVQDNIEYIVEYDCPLIWSAVSPEDRATYPTVSSSMVPSDVSISISCDAGPKPNFTRQRPFYPHSTSLIELLASAALLPTLPLLFHISTILRGIVEAHLGWHNRSVIGKAARIAFGLDASYFLHYLIPPPLVQVLFIIDRQQAVGRLSAMETAYVVLSLLGNVWLVGSYIWILKALSHFYLRRLWIRSFERDWHSNVGRGWMAYFRFENWMDRDFQKNFTSG